MHNVRVPFLILAVIGFVIGLPSQSPGDVVIDISGVIGGSTFDWVFSSTSITTNGDYTDVSDSNVTAGLPFPDDDNDNVTSIGGLPRSGDQIVNTSLANLSSTGDLVLQIDGGADLAGSFTIDIETTGDGRIDFDPDSNIQIVASPGVHTYTYSGSGTATLSSGTFDSVFNDGSAVYTAAPNGLGGFNTVTFNVSTNATAVPEPGGLALLGFCGIADVLRRKRKRGKQSPAVAV
ncbi:PEP-CTERM sorting domain-containing protein [Neorhodopirellula lusitana]|uniref:PEP-CTERM sorting domain-containing protein n=1 Tax=Neorhodopirellula lusitana TaxID=445327 RepID=UPI003850036B